MTQTAALIVNTKAGPKQVVDARFWMGRSNSASVVYCSIWIHGNGFECSGRGQAGGYGYHKPSAAFAAAVGSAGIQLAKPVDGVGDSAVRDAIETIGQAMGYRGKMLFTGIG